MDRKEVDLCLQAIAEGDQTALIPLYDTYYQAVFLLSASLVSQAALAEDITQEVFMAIRQCAGRYRPGTNARAWIFAITKNLCRYHLRRERYEFPTEAAGEAEWAEFDKECLENIVVADALSTLNAAEYRVTVLHVFVGLTLREIGELLGIPYGTVLWRFSQAKKKLRRFYLAAGEKGDGTDE